MHRDIQLSFEFFPPKTTAGQKNLTETAKALKQYWPSFYSVTFGAGGSTREGTIDTVKLLKDLTKLLITPHLVCVGSRKNEIIETLRKYQTINVKHIVALRGDLPGDMENIGEFKYASELVSLIRETLGNAVHLTVATYPEIHPQARDAFADIENLKRKFEAGADDAITQYFFNPESYFAHVDLCQKFGIDMPIIPGVMPITQFDNLIRFSNICGAEIPRWIYKRLETYRDDIVSIKQFGLEIVSNLCERLILGGAPGIHFYTLNKSEPVVNILENLISNNTLKIHSTLKKHAF